MMGLKLKAEPGGNGVIALHVGHHEVGDGDPGRVGHPSLVFIHLDNFFKNKSTQNLLAPSHICN